MLQCFFTDLNTDEFVKGMYLHVHCRLTTNPNVTDPVNLKMPTYIGWRNFQRQMDVAWKTILWQASWETSRTEL